jgi:hypothetical protein
LAPRWAWKTTLGSWYFFRAFFSPLFISQRSPNCTDCVHSRLYAPLFLYDWASCIVKFKGNGLLQDILAEQRKLDRKWLEVNVMKRPWLFSIIWTLPWQKISSSTMVPVWMRRKQLKSKVQRCHEVCQGDLSIETVCLFLLYIFWI